MTCEAFESRESAGTLMPVLSARSSNFAITSAECDPNSKSAVPRATTPVVRPMAATPTPPSDSANCVATVVAVPIGSLIVDLRLTPSPIFDSFAAAVSAPVSRPLTAVVAFAASLTKALKSASNVPVSAISRPGSR